MKMNLDDSAIWVYRMMNVPAFKKVYPKRVSTYKDKVLWWIHELFLDEGPIPEEHYQFRQDVLNRVLILHVTPDKSAASLNAALTTAC